MGNSAPLRAGWPHLLRLRAPNVIGFLCSEYEGQPILTITGPGSKCTRQAAPHRARSVHNGNRPSRTTRSQPPTRASAVADPRSHSTPACILLE
jgi:hypothetical protein